MKWESLIGLFVTVIAVAYLPFPEAVAAGGPDPASDLTVILFENYTGCGKLDNQHPQNTAGDAGISVSNSNPTIDYVVDFQYHAVNDSNGRPVCNKLPAELEPGEAPCLTQIACECQKDSTAVVPANGFSPRACAFPGCDLSCPGEEGREFSCDNVCESPTHCTRFLNVTVVATHYKTGRTFQELDPPVPVLTYTYDPGVPLPRGLIFSPCPHGYSPPPPR